MSNKTQLQSNNETLASILSNVLGLPSQESLKHGAYVWKKHQYIEHKDITMAVVSKSDPSVLQVTSNDYDLTVVDVSFFDGYVGTFTDSGTDNKLTFMEDGKVKDEWGSSSLVATYTYDATTQRITITGLGWATTPKATCSKEPSKPFVDFVVSDNETAYPDGGEQDGYWYEKVVEGVDLLGMFGSTKMAVDSFILTSNTKAYGYIASHSLGEKPKYALLYPNAVPLTVNEIAFCLMDKEDWSTEYYDSNNFIRYGSNNRYYFYNYPRKAIVSENTIQFSDYSTGSEFFKAGVEYTLITMA